MIQWLKKLVYKESNDTYGAWEVDECKRLVKLGPYQGSLEYRLPCGARIDILTNEYAIEVDWAPKWAEAIGQSLYYALSANSEIKKAENVLQEKAPYMTVRPAIILLVQDFVKDRKHIDRCKLVCDTYGIKLFLEAATK